MNLFTINHSPNGALKPCVCERHDVRNQINLDMLTEVSWEDDMWLLHFGATYYRVHDKEKMKALEEALWPPEVDE